MQGNDAEPHPAQPEPPSGDGVSATPAVASTTSSADEHGPTGGEAAQQLSAPDIPALSLPASRSGDGARTPAISLRSRAMHRLGAARTPSRAPAAEPASAWNSFVGWWNERNRQRRARKADADTFSTIVVERDDSLAAICGKLDSTPLALVAVLIPHGNHELGHPLSVRRLMRHADLSGKDIVLVTRNLAIRQRAQAEGQPVAGRLRRVRFRRASSQGLQLGGLDLALPGAGTLFGLFAFFVFLGAAFVAVFWYLPVATVTIFPRAVLASQVQTVSIDSQATSLDTAKLIVPAVRRQIDVTRVLFVPATGATNVTQADGKLLPVPAVTAKDLAFAKALAPAALKEQGLTNMQSRYGALNTIFPESAQVQVISVQDKQKAGEATSFLEVTVQGSVSMLTVANSDLRKLFTTLLQPQIRSDQALIDSSFHLNVQAAGPYDRGADKLPAKIQAQVGVTRALDQNALAHQIEGKSRHDASSYLDQTLAPIQRPAVKLSPGWAPWVPRWSKHIHINLQMANQ